MSIRQSELGYVKGTMARVFRFAQSSAISAKSVLYLEMMLPKLVMRRNRRREPNAALIERIPDGARSSWKY